MDTWQIGAITGGIIGGMEASRERASAIRARDDAYAARLAALSHHRAAMTAVQSASDMQIRLSGAEMEIGRLRGRVDELTAERRDLLAAIEVLLDDEEPAPAPERRTGRRGLSPWRPVVVPAIPQHHAAA